MGWRRAARVFPFGWISDAGNVAPQTARFWCSINNGPVLRVAPARQTESAGAANGLGAFAHRDISAELQRKHACSAIHQG
jgi:hypothetical protein